MPLVGSREEGFLASRPIAEPEEEDVALALIQAGVDIEYETLLLREEKIGKRGEILFRGAVCDYLVSELDVVIEVRLDSTPIVPEPGKKEPNKIKQRRMARQCGYGFAIVYRLRHAPDVLYRKVVAVLRTAAEDAKRAKKEFPDWEQRRALAVFDRRYRLLLERKKTG